MTVCVRVDTLFFIRFRGKTEEVFKGIHRGTRLSREFFAIFAAGTAGVMLAIAFTSCSTTPTTPGGDSSPSASPSSSSSPSSSPSASPSASPSQSQGPPPPPVQYEVDLTWDAPESSADPVASYNVYRSIEGTSAWAQIGDSPDSETAYSDTEVDNGSSYSYYVTSVDGQGNQSAPSNIFSVTIPSGETTDDAAAVADMAQGAHVAVHRIGGVSGPSDNSTGNSCNCENNQPPAISDLAKNVNNITFHVAGPNGAVNLVGVSIDDQPASPPVIGAVLAKCMSAIKEGFPGCDISASDIMAVAPSNWKSVTIDWRCSNSNPDDAPDSERMSRTNLQGSISMCGGSTSF